jgi:predicted ATPase/class 3 adenylate cyclase
LHVARDRHDGNNMGDLPSGTVTFLFSDVEGSTQLLERHGAAMGAALTHHHASFEDVVGRHGGAIFETVGDAVYAAFARPGDAIAAALEAQRALGTEDWGSIGRLAVRIALHSGQVERRGDHYFGPALFRAARLQALGYGEQTLLSGVTARLVADELPTDASLRALGTHRLKDLGQPEQVFQLVHPELRADFPALKSLDAHPHNLPVQLSSFIGRDAELAELAELLDQHRLLSLLGPGGIGKTRLALQAAAQQSEGFADGVWFVDLSAVRDPELVPGAIAATLGLGEQPGQPILVTLAEHFHSRRLLLVLDNLEQLLPAAAASVAELLTAGPDLHLLVTSRAPLRVRGEREFSVPPLAAGASDRLEAEPPPAVALFVERARAIKPNLELTSETGPLIAAICERLDGLPLAIELGAARLRLFSVPQLHDRLTQRLPLLTGGARDLPERQQTLRAAIAWSEELLSDPERLLFARLGVFVGGFSLEAAEAIAGPDLGGDVLAALTALVEQSLVRLVDGPGDQPRYAMLETIREYALERAEGRGELEEASRRHAGYFADVAIEAEPALGRGLEEGLLTSLATDHGNFIAALRAAELGGDWAVMMRVVTALERYWILGGRVTEGRDWFERSLAAAPEGPSNAAAAKILSGLASMAVEQGRLEDARKFLDRARKALANGPEAAQLGIRLDVLLARVLWSTGHPEAARQIRRATVGATADGDPLVRARILADIADDAIESGDHEGGRQLLEESLAAAIALDDHYTVGRNLANLGELALMLGDLPEARKRMAESASLARRLGLRLPLVDNLLGFAKLELREGKPEAAVRVWAAAEAALRTMGAALPAPWEAAMNALGGEIRSLLSDDAFASAWAEGSTFDLETAVDMAIEGTVEKR